MSFIVLVKAKRRERHRQPELYIFKKLSSPLPPPFFKKKKEVLKLGTGSFLVQEIPN